MRYFPSVIAFVVITAGTVTALAQEEDYAVESVTTIRQFVKFELTGGRLPPDGWRRAATEFFLEPKPTPSEEEVHVVTDRFYVRLETLTESKVATVSASFPVCWGKIDGQLRFTPTGARIPADVEVRADCYETYKLVQSPQNLVLTPGGQLKPFTTRGATLKYRIVDFPKYLLLNRSAAIRYVTEMRDKSNDPVIKKNADKTLSILGKLRE